MAGGREVETGRRGAVFKPGAGAGGLLAVGLVVSTAAHLSSGAGVVFGFGAPVEPPQPTAPVIQALVLSEQDFQGLLTTQDTEGDGTAPPPEAETPPEPQVEEVIEEEAPPVEEVVEEELPPENPFENPPELEAARDVVEEPAPPAETATLEDPPVEPPAEVDPVAPQAPEPPQQIAALRAPTPESAEIVVAPPPPPPAPAPEVEPVATEPEVVEPEEEETEPEPEVDVEVEETEPGEDTAAVGGEAEIPPCETESPCRAPLPRLRPSPTGAGLARVEAVEEERRERLEARRRAEEERRRREEQEEAERQLAEARRQAEQQASQEQTSSSEDFFANLDQALSAEQGGSGSNPQGGGAAATAVNPGSVIASFIQARNCFRPPSGLPVVVTVTARLDRLGRLIAEPQPAPGELIDSERKRQVFQFAREALRECAPFVQILGGAPYERWSTVTIQFDSRRGG